MNKNMNLNLKYPQDPNYDYFVKLNIIDLDKECNKDLSNGHGFVIREPQQINKTIKSEYSIFSSKFGRSLQDDKPYSHRFSCKYGCTQGAFFAVENDANWVCPICGTEVKLKGDDFTYFGWIILKDEYTVIHPTLYTLLASLIGASNLEAIIEPTIELDINGNPMSLYDRRILRQKNLRKFKKKTKIDNTFEGIGMLEFRKRFDEIVNYFYKKKSNKTEVYNTIMTNKEKVFIHCIPVYTTQLRIYKVENKKFTFEQTNAEFNLIAKLVATINKDHLSIYKNKKYQNQLLWDIQSKLNSLSEEVINILAEKKGNMRSAITGRVAFSARTVIIPDETLKMDELALPYYALVLLLEQIIINILRSSYNITYAEAYKKWYYATLTVDERILQIINNLIKMDKIHVLINRTPTLSYHSIIWKRVVKCNTDSIVMGLDQFVLKGLNADFDGDTLSTFLILNKNFDEVCQKIYSPRNAFCISRNDGLMNDNINVFKDTLINFSALLSDTNRRYSPEQLANIKRIQEQYKIK